MSKEKILVVEDSPDISTMLEFYFKLQGYEVMVALLGQDALDICRKTPPNLVLLDVNLPDIGGYDIGLWLRQSVRTRHIPIIFLTARTEKHDRLRGLGEIKAEYYVDKPFDIEELQTIVKGTLARASQKKQVHPVTNLPIGTLVDEQYRSLFSSTGWALAMIHISEFTTFMQFNGTLAGEEVLKFTALLLSDVVNQLGSPEDFIGQMIVVPDFVVISSPERIDSICMELCRRFDAESKPLYNFRDRQDGSLEVLDEHSGQRRVPLMTLSIGVVTGDDGPFSDMDALNATARDTYQRAQAEARERGLKSHTTYHMANREKPIERPPRPHKPSPEELARQEARAMIEDVVRSTDLSVLTVRIEGGLAGARALHEVIALPYAGRVLALNETDLLASVPSALVGESIVRMIDGFYSDALVQRHDARLTFGVAAGPAASADDLIEAAARDLIERRYSQDRIERRHSEGIAPSGEPAILFLQPGRAELQKRYKAASANCALLRKELDVQLDAVHRLTAGVDHDLNGGFSTLKSAIGEAEQSVSEPPEQAALRWMAGQVVLCTAWQRSVAELGTGRTPQRRGLELAAWLDEQMWLLHRQLELPFALTIDLPDALLTTLDPEALLVACLHLLLSLQAAEVSMLRITSTTIRDDSSFTLIFEDDGRNMKRLQALQSGYSTEAGELPWRFQNLLLLQRVLRVQGIALDYQQRGDRFQMIWHVPGQQFTVSAPGQPLETYDPVLPLDMLEDEVLRLEREVAQLRFQVSSPAQVPGTPDIDMVQHLLLPYVQELRQNMEKLVDHAESDLKQIDPRQAKHIKHISLYCHLLVCNLALALHGVAASDEAACDINEQVQQVCNLLEHKLEQHLRVVLRLAPDLPPVALTPLETKQVLMNLIRNAVEATEPGGELQITASHRGSQVGSWVVIQIRDSGVGIPIDHRDKIFKLNFSTRGKQGANSGVGLHAVRSIVERAQGRIRVASATVNDKGALTFWSKGFAAHHNFHWTAPGSLFQIELPIGKGR
jgi:DNA-binding response OmpR family regulator/signal transduction histidine kinase